jgi:fructokinase
VAVGIARLGGNSGFIGRVGDDPFGRFMRHTLQQEQVDVSHMRLDGQHRTSTVVVDLDDQGERTFTFMVRPSADLFLAKKTCRSLPPTSGCTSAPSRSAPSPAAAPFAAMERKCRRPGQL